MSVADFAKLCAIRRDDKGLADEMLHDVATRLQAEGLTLAGVLQRDTMREGRRRCDMDLIDLGSGDILRISEDRGNEARGCRLDTSAMADAAARIESGIALGANLVIINKFGKAEGEGRGLRDVIAVALAQDIPVLLGVSETSIEALRAFAGDYCTVTSPDREFLDTWLVGNLLTIGGRAIDSRGAGDVIEAARSRLSVGIS